MSGAGHGQDGGHGSPENKKIALLIWVSAGLGILGAVFCAIGFFAPASVHLF